MLCCVIVIAVWIKLQHEMLCPVSLYKTNTNRQTGRQTDHLLLVVCIDAHLLEEGDDEDEEVLVVPIQQQHQLRDDALVPHFLLNGR